MRFRKYENEQDVWLGKKIYDADENEGRKEELSDCYYEAQFLSIV